MAMNDESQEPTDKVSETRDDDDDDGDDGDDRKVDGLGRRHESGSRRAWLAFVKARRLNGDRSSRGTRRCVRLRSSSNATRRGV